MFNPTADFSHTVELFLELSVLRYSIDPKTSKWSHHGGPYPHDSSERRSQAAMLLGQDPNIAQDSIHTAVVAQDVERVRAFLDRDSSLAARPHDFDGWQPLMRLAYTRLPGYSPSSTSGASTRFEGAGENTFTTASSPSLIIARLLLEAGADPSGGPLKGDAQSFTALTGVIGGGEHGQPPHPEAEDLARLLIEHGADPLDGQALYNTSLVHGREDKEADSTADDGDEVHWLEFLWEEDVKRRIKDSGDDKEARKNAEAQVCARWREPLPNGTLPTPPFGYLLRSAVMQHQPRRVKWLLEHGGDANAGINVAGGEEGKNETRSITLAEAAEAKGFGDVADLLLGYRKSG